MCPRFRVTYVTTKQNQKTKQNKTKPNMTKHNQTNQKQIPIFSVKESHRRLR